ncbi:coiled-coil domain-containing protein 30-like [Clytia hemisphaerica]
MKTFGYVSLWMILILVYLSNIVKSEDVSKSLILTSVQNKEQSGKTPSITSSTKFDHVIDQALLESELNKVDEEFNRIQKLITIWEKNLRVLYSKEELQDILKQDLTTIQTETSTLEHDLIILSEKSISLKDLIPKNANKAIKKKIKQLKKTIQKELQKGLVRLINDFECKLKERCSQDSLKEAESSFFSKVNDIGEVHEQCDDFTQECVDSYKEILNKFDDYTKDHVSPLKTQLHDLKKSKCSQSKTIRKTLESRLKSLEKKVQHWIETILSKLKELIEQKLTQLSDGSKYNFDVLNGLRLDSKDKKKDPDALQEIKTKMVNLKQTSVQNYNEFNQVYQYLFEFKHLLADNEKQFKKYFEIVTKLRYVIIGFQAQIDEYLTVLLRKIKMASFEIDSEEFDKKLEDFLLMFEEELRKLLQVGLSETCSKLNEFETTFDVTFREQLELLNSNYETLQNNELSSEDLDQAYFDTKLSILSKKFEKLTRNNQYHADFVEIFKHKFC